MKFCAMAAGSSQLAVDEAADAVTLAAPAFACAVEIATLAGMACCSDNAACFDASSGRACKMTLPFDDIAPLTINFGTAFFSTTSDNQRRD